MVGIPPLCIIQARYHSRRLPGKMLLKLGGETLIARAIQIASRAFAESNVVLAVPSGHENLLIEDIGRRYGIHIFAYAGGERDVLGRFYACAHTYRWHPDSIVVRYTPDDWRKDESSLLLVAAGVRLPVECGGEAFTLAQLDEAQRRVPYMGLRDSAVSGGEYQYPPEREHISHALFQFPAPAPPDDGLPWSIDIESDYLAVKSHLEKSNG